MLFSYVISIGRVFKIEFEVLLPTIIDYHGHQHFVGEREFP